MNGPLRLALAAALATLAACSTLPVDFAEPAGARVRVGRSEPATLPATVGVVSPFPADVELDFDAQTLVAYGMVPERAAALVAAGKARIVGRLAVRGASSASSASEGERLRFAIPGTAVVRALESGQRLRCWWPAEGTRRLWFVSDAEGGSEWFRTVYGEKTVVAHTPGQRSAEMGAMVGGVVVGLAAIVVLAIASM